MPMKTLTHSRLELAQRCLRKFRKDAARHRGTITPEVELAKIVGKAVEEATAVSDPKIRARLIDIALDQIDDDAVSAVALERIESCVANSDELRAGEQKSTVRKQRQFRWWDTDQTGWKLVAKPDFIRFARDPSGRPLIQVIDEKTATVVTSYQKRFLFFLGLVIRLQIAEEQRIALMEAKRLDINPTYTVSGFLAELVNEYGLDVIYSRVSIEMIIRLLGDSSDPDAQPREVSIGFKSHHRDAEQLEEIRRVIRKIEASFEANDFPAKVGWYCDSCPFKADCETYQQSLVAQDELAETA